ncbi:MAG: glycosyltransferase family 39 protein, partial [Clostridia bacterium]|nr:glycosyltransferase family 39 protein [Clostridia bacterium]
MIITPLFPYICALILKIFGDELVVLRVFECLEIALIFFLIYKIMLKLKINRGIELIYVIRHVYLLC